MTLSKIARRRLLMAFVIFFIFGIFGPIAMVSNNCAVDTNEFTAQIESMTISTALKMHKLKLGFYPDTQTGLKALVTNKWPVADNSERSESFLTELPCDPWNNPYVYRYPAEPQPTDYAFDIYSMGPNGIDDNKSGDDVYNTWKGSD